MIDPIHRWQVEHNYTNFITVFVNAMNLAFVSSSICLNYRLIFSVYPRSCICSNLFFLFFFFFCRILGIPSGGQHRNLPCLTAHFVGRDADVNEILKKLQTFRMVVLLSIPGMGKTEVGIRVSQLLEQSGDKFVAYIRVEKHHRKLVDVCSEIVDRLSSRTWSPNADFISLAKRKLSERTIPSEENQVTLAMFQEAYDMRRTLPEEEQKSQTHAHTASKLGVCLVLQVRP